MYTRLSEADEIIDALRDHMRGLCLRKASPQSEGGGHSPRGNHTASRPTSGKTKHGHQIADLETVLTLSLFGRLFQGKTRSATHVEVSHLTPVSYKPKFFQENSKEALAVVQGSLFSRKEKLMIMS